MRPDKSLRLNYEATRALFSSKIPDLRTLRTHLPTCTLIAFDTEGVTQNFAGRLVPNSSISELGVAVLQPHADRPAFITNLTQFYEDNDIEAFTIRMHPRTYGPVVGLMTSLLPSAAGPRLFDFISQFPGDRILLGFYMQSEWRWISRHFPSFAELFIGWCDVQELVAQRYVERSPPSSPDALAMELRTPGLARTLKAMGIYGWTRAHQEHGGAGDAVKCLAILSGLLHDIPLADVPLPKRGVSKYCFLPKSKNVGFSGRYHFHTARISASNNQKLPLQTPNGLEALCAAYLGLLGVGLNSKTEAVPRGPVRSWWVSFSSQTTLEDFAQAFDGSDVDGVRVKVVIDQREEKKATHKQRSQMTRRLNEELDLSAVLRYVANDSSGCWRLTANSALPSRGDEEDTQRAPSMAVLTA